MNPKLKIGVVGAGVFGRFHVQKCEAHPQIALVGIYDNTPNKNIAIAKRFNTELCTSFESLLDRAEAVIIASPAQSHGALAIKALDLGKHCFIEKPIASSLSETKKILALSRSNGAVVQVGHQERFVIEAIGLKDVPERPVKITGYRMGKYSQRGTDVSVTLDLMVHDLDLLSLLTGESPSKISGHAISVQSDHPDASLGFLEFPSGCKARLHASRAENENCRSMEIVYPSGTVHIDFNAKTLTHNTPFDLDVDFAQNPIAKDSLGAGTNAFVQAILNGIQVPVSAEDGYRALEMALIIDRGELWEKRE